VLILKKGWHSSLNLFNSFSPFNYFYFHVLFLCYITVTCIAIFSCIGCMVMSIYIQVMSMLSGQINMLQTCLCGSLQYCINTTPLSVYFIHLAIVQTDKDKSYREALRNNLPRFVYLYIWQGKYLNLAKSKLIKKV
jgi:hypothetical protein